MQKTKRNTPAILNNFWVKSVEFVSDFSVDECADRLARRNEWKPKFFVNRNKLKIEVNYDHQDELYTFTMKRDGGRNLIATAQGYLDALDEHQTSVYVQAQQDQNTYILVGLFFVIFMVAVLLSPQPIQFENAIPLAIMLSLGILFVFHVTLINARNELIQIVEDTLAPEKRK